MKHIGAIVALSLLAGRGLAAQDTTKAAPAPPPPPPASPRVRARGAAPAQGGVGRVPRDTRSVFPVGLGPALRRAKGGGAPPGGAAGIHPGGVHGGPGVG